ncbi:hypothetical protein [Bacillus massilinigeriensis]|nr:hypothetical protein [Bacillus massilionigeriensis]
MAGMWITVIGFVICLGVVGGTLFHYLRSAMNTEDSTRIDRLKESKEKH